MQHYQDTYLIKAVHMLLSVCQDTMHHASLFILLYLFNMNMRVLTSVIAMDMQKITSDRQRVCCHAQMQQ